jgi:uncharacterized protein (TIGR02677 family)
VGADRKSEGRHGATLLTVFLNRHAFRALSPIIPPFFRTDRAERRMTASSLHPSAPQLFSHVVAENGPLYRAILDVFATAKRQFRLHLRPDDVLAEARWPDGTPPTLEAVQQALGQLVEWGNLQAQPDTARVSTIEDFYRKRLLYRMTVGGEAVEAGLQAFNETLARRAELQSVALEDIRARLISIRELMSESPPDSAKVHGALRDLVHIFASLSNNAESFMAGLARTIELQRADVAAVMSFKTRLIDYLQRFIGDLVTRSSQIAELLLALAPAEASLLRIAAERDARNAAPDEADTNEEAIQARLVSWAERWEGLKLWFLSNGRERSQAELLRASALAAIPRLLQAISVLHERRAGRSDRAADFRRLALWFAEAPTNADAHRLWRAAFALSPARHLALAITDAKVSANTPWPSAPGISVLPKLREQGVLPTRGAPPRIQDRSKEREALAARVALEVAQTEAARAYLATNREIRLSELGRLDAQAFRMFLALLGEALAAQTNPDEPVERQTGDGTLLVRLVPLDPASHAELETELGRFSGRDHHILIRRT